jgi:hypothetical protein
MRRALILLVLHLLILSCAGVPRLTPSLTGGRKSPASPCATPFLVKGWRLIHSISGTFPGGGGTTMIGVTEARPEKGSIHCVLMSVEGLVLCDAVYDGKLTITRGIGPFSSPDMVMGMVRDIRLMLFAPAGAPAETGTVAGARTCRYRSGDDVTDVSPGPDGSVDLVFYSGGRRSRTARFSRLRGDGLPGRVELEARGAVGYTLLLDLIEAGPVQ